MTSYYPSYPPGPSAVTVHPQSSTAHVVVAWIVTAVTFAYMLPWAIAATRSHKDVTPIALVNLFLGWSLVGWIVSLVWSLGTPYPTQVVLVHPGYAHPGPVSAPTRPAPHAIAPYSQPSATQAFPTQPYPTQSADQWQPAPWDRPSGTHG